MDQRQLRVEWKAYWKACPDPKVRRSFPPHLRELQCGAKAKSTGQPCKRKDLHVNGRCKLHGGKSTGVKTAAGRRQCAINGAKGGRPRKSKQ